MPPKKKSTPLEGTVICISGKLPESQSNVQGMIMAAGGAISASITKKTTHLITSPLEFHRRFPKVEKAQADKVPIVNFAWLDDSVKKGKAMPVDDPAYDLSKQPLNGDGSSKKRDAPDDDSDEDLAAGGSPKKLKGPSKPRTPPPAKAGPVTKSRVDKYCRLRNTHDIYVAPSGEPLECTLSQTQIGKNANKAYFLQLLVPKGGGDTLMYARWGRVGEVGQTQEKGPWPAETGIKEFHKQFRSKTGFAWEDRMTAASKPGKYSFLVTDDESQEQDGGNGDATPGPSSSPTKPGASSESPSKEAKALPSKLHPQVRDLANIIFSTTNFNTAMESMNLDAKKLPLGKIGKATLERGIQQLDRISTAINSHASAQELEQLSNTYLSLIPRFFHRNARPAVINTLQMVQSELDVLDSLGAMDASRRLMELAEKESDNGVHPADARIKALNLRKLEPVEVGSKEWEVLCEYSKSTHGSTHGHLGMKIESIFRVERQPEESTFKEIAKEYKGKSDRRLLWHGSRAANFGGILDQGLLIAPPTAPVQGYMFGKGIYLADCFSKSAGYTFPHLSGQRGLLLLCEAELGPQQKLVNADYNAGDTCPKGGHTLGAGIIRPSKWKDAGKSGLKGLTGVQMPDGGLEDSKEEKNGLYYNEYIVYTLRQIRFRYLFCVNFNG